MRISIANVIRLSASKALKKWKSNATAAWKEVSSEERDVLKKYANIFLKKLKKEKFPDADKAILRRHAKGFVTFLKGLE